MQTLKLSTALTQIKEGKFECNQDIRVGLVEITTAKGVRKTIKIIEG